MRIRRLLGGFGALLVGTALVVSWPAGAEPGSFSDPDDTNGGIDVKTLTHSDTPSQITLAMEAYESWPDTDSYTLQWDLDLDNDLSNGNEVCVYVDNSGGGAIETAAVYDQCSNTKLEDATASRSGATVTVTFNKSALAAATRPLAANDTTYTYEFSARDHTASTTDPVPNNPSARITHTLTAQSGTTTTGGGGTTTTAGGGTTTTAGGGTTTTTAGGGTTTTTAGGGTTTTTAGGGTTTSTTRASTTTTVGSAATTTAPPSNGSESPCPSPSRATITPSTAVPGQEVTVRGGGPNCFKPNSTLEIVYTSDPVVLGTTTTDAFGRYAVTVKIPRNSTSGSHTITVRGPAASSGTHSSVGGITIIRGSLPRTGGDAGDLTRLGLFALGAGALLALTALRHRETVLGSVRHRGKHFRR